MSRCRLPRFAADQNGSVALIFALSLFVLLGCAGVAVDFARAHSSKSALQEDLDATVLYAAGQKASLGTQFDEQQAAQDYMTGLSRQKQTTGKLSVSITQIDAKKYRGDATVTVPSTILRVLGGSDLTVNVTSEAEVADNPVEIALVLDNTGSMNGAKIDALKRSAKELVDTAFKGPDAAANVTVSVVPFAQYVNVGQANRNASWMSVPQNTSTKQNVCQDVQQPTPVPGSCHQVSSTYNSDGVPETAETTECQYTYGPPTTQCSDVTTATTWNGCAGSRDYPLNVKDQDYSTKVPGVMNVPCPTEITPLINDQPTIGAAIDAMAASGETYIPAGLIWGWATLSSQAPFSEAKDVIGGEKVRKILVLMTDGYNTLSPTVPYDGSHNNNSTAQSNAYTSELCTNIKAAGIEIYSVAFEVADPAIKQILEDCASAGSKYFDASNNSDLQLAFQKIAAEFAPLRITH